MADKDAEKQDQTPEYEKSHKPGGTDTLEAGSGQSGQTPTQPGQGTAGGSGGQGGGSQGGGGQGNLKGG
jgi:hypothetical protein